MINIFKINKYWFLTFVMMCYSLASLAQDCPSIIGIIKTNPPSTPGNCQVNVIANPTMQTISSRQTTAVFLTSSTLGTTFTWTVTQTGLTGASTGNGNTIAQTLTNIGSQPGIATYTVTPILGNCSGIPITVVINVQSLYKNVTKNGSFIRNNCGTGTGSAVTYIVPANTYSSTYSQADADAQAQNDVNNNGQTYANTNGTCSYLFKNIAKSGVFIRNNCGTAGTGSAVSYIVPANTYSSASSQANADDQAQNDVNNNGQTYANNNGTCSSLFRNITKSGTFTKNNCGTGGTGSTITYTVPANTYTSATSQADADAQAQNDVNNNGQTYANTNGTCSYLFRNIAKSGSFNRNNCGTGGTGSTITYTVPANTYTSASSQADADTQAQNDVNNNGQTYANTNGTCSYLFKNIAKSGVFIRNNCGTGGTGSTVTYDVTANTYSSTSSQADADTQAQNDVNNNGQTYANTNGTCSYFFRNIAKSGSFTRNNCGTGGTGSTVTYTVTANTYSSTSSQADADTQAQNDVNNNGQTYANTNGTCSYLFRNIAKSGSFTKNNCSAGETGSTVTYTVPANTYTSISSQADADAQAQNAVNANGQAYSNTNGICNVPVFTYGYRAFHPVDHPGDDSVTYIDSNGDEQTIILPRSDDGIICILITARKIISSAGATSCTP